MSRPFHVGTKTTRGRGMKGEPPNDEMVKPPGPEQSSTTLLEGAVMTEIQLGTEVIKLCFHLSEQF